MLNKDKRVDHYDIDQVIGELEKSTSILSHQSSYERIFLTILYEIQDIKESIDRMDDEMRGYDP